MEGAGERTRDRISRTTFHPYFQNSKSDIPIVPRLRSLFFLLRGAASKFDFLQQGIAIVLIFIGVKMLITEWVHIPVWVSLLVIVFCISGSIMYSIYHKRKGVPKDVIDNNL